MMVNALLSLCIAAAGAAASPTAPSAPSAPSAPFPPSAPSATAAANGAILPGSPRIAVMHLSSLGSTEEAVQAIENVLVDELRKLLGDRLTTPQDFAAKNKAANDDINGCDGVLDCLKEVLGAHGFSALIVGNLAGLGEDRVINLKLIDLTNGRELMRHTEKATGDERELIRQIRKAAVLLLSPESYVGVVELRAEQPDVSIAIDGQLVGITPLSSPRVTVAAGRHAVEATGEGLVPLSTMVDVAYREVVPLTIQLPTNTLFVSAGTPFRARWWTWAIVAAGLASMGAGGYFYYQHDATANEMSKLAAEGNLDADRVGLRQDWEDHLTAARAFAGSGAVLLTGAGVLLIVDFF